MDSKFLASFPRVNLISILAGTLALISVFLPWWGITGSAYGFSASVNWSLWGQPYIGDPSSSAAIARATMTMGVFNVMILALVFISAALAFLGSFDANKGYLSTGFAASITTVLVYAAAVSYTLTIACQGTTPCPSGPTGSTVFTSGDIANWGFQIGFYLLLLAGILTLFAVIFHQAFLTPKETIVQGITSHPIKFCSNCASPVQPNAKFCSHCASPVTG